MFLSVSLLCTTILCVSILPTYNLAVTLQLLSTTEISKQAVKKSPNKTEDAVSQTPEEWKSSHKDLLALAQSNSTLANNLINWGKLTDGLREEILVMADGSHLKFPHSLNNETDQQYKTISIAASKLLMNLKTMQQTDNLIRNITLKLYRNNIELFFRTDFGRSSSGRKLPETILRTLMQDFFRILNNQMETDEVLGGEYKKRMNEAREIVKKDSKMSGPLIEIKAWDEYTDTDEQMKLFEDKKKFRRLYLNDIFLEFENDLIEGNSSSSNRELIERSSLARALIQKGVSSPSSESKVNDLYQRAVDIAEERLWNERMWTYSDSRDYVKIGKILFDSLEKTLISDSVLYEEIKSLKKEIEPSVYENTTMN